MYYYNFTGDVTNSNVQGVIQHFNTKRIEENSQDEFSIYLSSVGGDIDAGIRLYDFLKSIPNKVLVYGFGQVDSSAIMILLAGDTRVALRNTRFRIHSPQFNLVETHAPLSYYTEIVNYFSELDRRMKEIITTETGKTLDEVEAIFMQGKILNAREGKDFGLIQRVSNELPTPQFYINKRGQSNSSPR
jgi:ATP-dependent Clp protease protease subunit